MSDPASVILFDLDGVLIDSFECWYAVLGQAARRFGLPDAVSRERMAELFGQGPEDDARLLFPGRSAAEVCAAYDEGMPQELGRIVVGGESHEVLDRLGRAGLRRAVVTNTQASLAGSMLETAGLLERLDAWVGVGGGLREKPAPDLLRAALEALGASSKEAVLVGDSRYDEEAAAAASVRFVPFDLRRGDSLKDALAPWLVPGA